MVPTAVSSSRFSFACSRTARARVQWSLARCLRSGPWDPGALAGVVTTALRSPLWR